MKIVITKANGITFDGKGYLVGIDQTYVLGGSIFEFKYKKYAEKFVKRILEQLQNNNNLLEVMRKEYSNYLNIESKQKQEEILDEIRKEYFNLLHEFNDVPTVSNDKQLINFAKNYIVKKLNIENLDNYLYYCN